MRSLLKDGPRELLVELLLYSIGELDEVGGDAWQAAGLVVYHPTPAVSGHRPPSRLIPQPESQGPQDKLNW